MKVHTQLSWGLNKFFDEPWDAIVWNMTFFCSSWSNLGDFHPTATFLSTPRNSAGTQYADYWKVPKGQ